MEYRRLGRSGLTVSEIAYGNAITHGGQVDDSTAQACVRTALGCGITTFDTADAYAAGEAEIILGRALAHEKREELEISTKVFWPTGTSLNERGLSRKHIFESCVGSLRRLQIDYIDLYQAHRYDATVPLEETMEAFADLVRQGKVLYIGVSEWPAEDIAAGALMARELRIPFVSNQPQYSMLWRVIEDSVIPTCETLGLTQIVWSPLAQGVLTGKYKPNGAAGADTRWGNDETGDETSRRILRRFTTADVLARVEQLRPLAEEAGLSMAQFALAWVLQNSNVSSAIIGASRPEQIEDNVKAAGVKLDDAVLAEINRILGDSAEHDPSLVARARP